MIIILSEYNRNAEFFSAARTFHGMLTGFPRQTQLRFAMRTGAVALGSDMLQTAAELPEKSTDAAKKRNVLHFGLYVGFQIPVFHVFGASCR